MRSQQRCQPRLALNQKQRPTKRSVQPRPVIDCEPGQVSPVMGSQPRIAFRLSLIADEWLGNVYQVTDFGCGPHDPGRHIPRKSLSKAPKRLQAPGAGNPAARNLALAAPPPPIPAGSKNAGIRGKTRGATPRRSLGKGLAWHEFVCACPGMAIFSSLGPPMGPVGHGLSGPIARKSRQRLVRVFLPKLTSVVRCSNCAPPCPRRSWGAYPRGAPPHPCGEIKPSDRLSPPRGRCS